MKPTPLVFPVLVPALLLVGCKTVVAPRQAHAPRAPVTVFRYDDLDAVLGSRVDEAGAVDYAGLAAEPQALERFYAQVASVSPDSHPDLFPGEDDRLAYWINAYNAAVLVSVVREYPLESVKDVRPPWYLFFLPDLAGFFYLREHVFGGRHVNLRDLENDVIRARFDEPRIHFALNCASRGCPRLPQGSFRPGTLEEQLDAETRRFFAEPRNLRLDDEGGVVRLSAILEWYAEDYLDWLAARGHEEPTLVDYAALHAGEETAAALRGRGRGYAVEFEPYDWGLNDRGRRPAP